MDGQQGLVFAPNLFRTYWHKNVDGKNRTIRNLVRINFTPDSELGGEPFKVPAIYKFSQI